jgi:hypothetical protein
MVVNCDEVWREVSNYLEGDLSPELRQAIDQHVGGCKRCAAVLDGTRNVVKLYGDERMLDVPLGFSHRMQRRLEENLHGRAGSRRGFMGWMVAAAAAMIAVGSFEVARSASRSNSNLRSEHAQSASGVPPDMVVLVSSDGGTDGRIFHRAGCTFIHDKDHVRTMVAREAMRDGYTPCVRCLKQYLSTKRVLAVRNAKVSS